MPKSNMPNMPNMTNMTNMTNMPKIEHIRKEFHRNSILAAHGFSVIMTAIADIEYHLEQLAEIEQANGTFAQIAQIAQLSDSLRKIERQLIALLTLRE